MSPELEQTLILGAEGLQSGTAIQKIERAMDFVQMRISWRYSDAAFPPPSFREVLKSGFGGCQHFAMLLAALLERAGIDVQLVTLKPAGEPGHVWLEAGDGGTKWVIDISKKTFFKPLLEVSAKAEQDPYSVEAYWYLNPERKFYEVR